VQTEPGRDGAAIITQMVELMPAWELFKGRRFDREVIVLCVRWYLSLTRVSYCDSLADAVAE
jgi:hypothetical protein